MEYIKYFKTEQERNTFLDSNDYADPHVSLAEESTIVDYYTHVTITMKASADTSVNVYYLESDYKNGPPNEVISLKANEEKTTIIHRPYIWRIGITDYDVNTLKRISANTSITEVTIGNYSAPLTRKCQKSALIISKLVLGLFPNSC